MKATPIGRMATVNAFIAPVVVAASAFSPSGATMSASQKPITAWVERARTIGHASVRSVERRAGPTGAGETDGDDTRGRQSSERPPAPPPSRARGQQPAEVVGR